MVNNFKKENLLAIGGGWLEEVELPPMVPRDPLTTEPEDLDRIIAIVGPRWAGKTFEWDDDGIRSCGERQA